ncbi:MAG TPA: phosphatase PAP2-related protein [Polyangiales bacterium]|nr:phosphatase PAP2-related protein [Polyangiales bacterium]
MPTEPTLNWSEALHSKRFVALAIATFAGLIAAMLSLNTFLHFNETRHGVQLIDPVLPHLPARDSSWLLFGTIYGLVFLALGRLARKPRALLIALQAYALLIFVRIAMMYCIPLEPPPGMIVLQDPFVRAFGDGNDLVKDLFFSGHTSTTFLCALTVTAKPLRLLCLAASGCVAVLVLVQHTHYTIDVLVAPFVAFTALHAAQSFTASVLDTPRR